MILRAQIQRVVRNQEGPMFETVFLLRDCDPTAPMWTRERHLAAELEWSEAEKLAPGMNAHAVVIAGSGITEHERAAQLPGATRQEKLSYYRRKLLRQRAERRAAADALASENAAQETRIIQFQSELERRKLA